jgi:hypothetical protein
MHKWQPTSLPHCSMHYYCSRSWLKHTHPFMALLSSSRSSSKMMAPSATVDPSLVSLWLPCFCEVTVAVHPPPANRDLLRHFYGSVSHTTACTVMLVTARISSIPSVLHTCDSDLCLAPSLHYAVSITSTTPLGIRYVLQQSLVALGALWMLCSH